MAKFEIVFLSRVKFIIILSIYLVSGRSIEEISIGLLAYFFDSFFL